MKATDLFFNIGKAENFLNFQFTNNHKDYWKKKTFGSWWTGNKFWESNEVCVAILFKFRVICKVVIENTRNNLVCSTLYKTRVKKISR